MTTRDRVLVFAALAIPTVVQGQGTQTAQRIEACRRAITMVNGPATAAERSNALSRLPRCGAEGGAILAQELRRGRTVSDTVALLKSYDAISRIVDASVLDAALATAADRGATDEARIIAFKVLITYHNPAFASAPVSSFVPGSKSFFGTQDHFVRLQGAALPPDWENSARNLLERLANDPQENAIIRHAARRALSPFRV